MHAMLLGFTLRIRKISGSQRRAICMSSMAKLTVPIFLLLLMMTTGSSAAQGGRKRKETRMAFYQHYFGEGSDINAHAVAGIGGRKWTGLEMGTLVVGDSPLTEGMERRSSKVGRAQGIYVSSTMDGIGAQLAFSIVFTAGPYNGSTVVIQGRDYLQPHREQSVVGGTGQFRYARGYCFAKTAEYKEGTLNGIIKITLSIRHPVHTTI